MNSLLLEIMFRKESIEGWNMILFISILINIISIYQTYVSGPMVLVATVPAMLIAYRGFLQAVAGRERLLIEQDSFNNRI